MGVQLRALRVFQKEHAEMMPVDLKAFMDLSPRLVALLPLVGIGSALGANSSAGSGGTFQGEGQMPWGHTRHNKSE